MKSILQRFDDLDRRRFLTRAAQSFLGVSLLPVADSARGWAESNLPVVQGSRSASAKRVIYLFMGGGMSHLDTFDPKPENKEVQGPVSTINTNVDGIRITENLPLLAKQMDKIALIRSMSHTQGNHTPGIYKFRTGYEVQPGLAHPALGAWTTRLGERNNPNLPSYVRVGDLGNHPASGFLPPKYAPLPISNPEYGLANSRLPKEVATERFQRKLSLAQRLDQEFVRRYQSNDIRAYGSFYEDAVAMMSSSDLDAFDLKQEPSALREAYGIREQFGQGVLLARRLVEHGVNFVEVDLGGWDTHSDNHQGVKTLSAILDRVLSTLLQDLNAKGMLDDTLVVLGTEFGRSAKIDEFKGRNHYPIAYSCLMAGGGVRGGQVIGETNEDGMQILGDPVSVHDFNATIGTALGVDTGHYVAPFEGGQKFSIAGKDTAPIKGKPIPGLLG